MTNYLKCFAIYVTGAALFMAATTYLLGVAWTPINVLCLGFVYFIANFAGDIECRVRRRGRA